MPEEPTPQSEQPATPTAPAPQPVPFWLRRTIEQAVQPPEVHATATVIRKADKEAAAAHKATKPVKHAAKKHAE